MSLKAKIEAVIYASDEPVTLAQLVGLLGHEAQAELDRAAEAQQMLALDDADPMIEPDLEAATAGAGADLMQPTLGDEAAKDGPPRVGAEVDTESASAEPEALVAEAVEPILGDETAKDGPPEVEAGPDAAAVSAGAARAEKARAAKLRGYFREVLDRLIAEYSAPESDRGLEIREVAGGFRIATKPEYHDAVRGFVKSLKPPLKLTLQALETLAVVAYKQPVTSPEISEIRGVDSSGVLGSLIARKLITTAGRKQVIGRPILYKTTKEFLLKFGLKDVAELPSIEEFEKMAGQMAEQEDIPMGDNLRPHETPESAAELEEERDEYSAQADGDSENPGPNAPADNISSEEKAPVDGRISSLPPDYSDDTQDDPSAREAEIQEREKS